MNERPFANTNEQGDFSLTTFVKDDGAPAGQYKVLISWRPPRSRNDGLVGRDAFGNRYFKPETTTLACTITEGDNALPPFELSTKQARD
jgi:hypothetical protein